MTATIRLVAMLHRILRRIAIVVLLAGQGPLTPGVRACIEHLPALNAAVQRVQRVAATAPRWGNSVDRLSLPPRLTSTPRSPGRAA